MVEHGIRNPPFILNFRPMGPHSYWATTQIVVTNNRDIDVYKASARELITSMCEQRQKRPLRFIDTSFCDYFLDQGIRRFLHISLIVFVEDRPIA